MRKLFLRLFSFEALSLLLLGASVVLNVMLARKINRLERAAHTTESLQNLTVGTSVPPLEVKELNGDKAIVNYSDGDKTTVIYVFTPQCMWCTRNLENIKALSANLSENYRVIGVSLTGEDLIPYIEKNQFGFPIYFEPSTGTKTNYKLGVTPKTIVVSSENQVVKTWNGAYTGDLKSEIEDFFKINLPNPKVELVSIK